MNRVINSYAYKLVQEFNEEEKLIQEFYEPHF